MRQSGGARRLVVLACVLCCLAGAAVLAQDRGFFGRFRRGNAPHVAANSEYDGKFVSIRLRYGPDLGEFEYRGDGGPGWSHDYPRADVHFMKILKEITFLAPRMDGSNIFATSDPELFNFPVAYMSEPGGWDPTEEEVEGLNAYLRKGGFVIFDDFDGYDSNNLEEQMRRVLPQGRFTELDGTHPIFHSFFEIDHPLDFIPPYGSQPPTFHGIFEDNDPNKRLMVIANYNNDIGEDLEFSDTGLMPIDLSNEAYKFGVNYIVYAMTH